jgi:hypothetical protein
VLNAATLPIASIQIVVASLKLFENQLTKINPALLAGFVAKVDQSECER